VSRVYQGLNRLNGALNALEISNNPDSLYVLAGRDSGLTQAVIAIVVDPPGPGTITEIDLDVQNLPWGGGAFTATLSRVIEASTATGIETVTTFSSSGGALQTTLSIPEGQAGLYLVEIDEL